MVCDQHYLSATRVPLQPIQRFVLEEKYKLLYTVKTMEKLTNILQSDSDENFTKKYLRSLAIFIQYFLRLLN